MNENKRSVVGTNEELAKAQTEWKEQYYDRLISGQRNIVPSCAFAFGMTDTYMESNKRVMIVGQQANGHTTDYEKWCLDSFREWNIRYLLKQTDEDVFDIECKKKSGTAANDHSYRYNRSAFWQLFRDMEKGGFGLAWNNLEKVREYNKGGKEILMESEENLNLLNEPLPSCKASLIKREIQIADPHFIIFAVGPRSRYINAINRAFQTQLEGYPTVEQPIIDVTEKLGLDIPAVWTYHPTFLRRSRLYDEVVARVLFRAHNEIPKRR